MSRELRGLWHQARMGRGVRRHFALLLLLGWLSLSAGIGVTLLVAQGSTFSSAYAATHLDCGPSTGTPQPTPPLEQPSTTVGPSGPGNLPCSTVTVPATVKPLPTGFVQTPIITTPNPNGPTSTAVPASQSGSQHGSGGQSCSGPLCFIGGVLQGAGSWLGHALGTMGTWLGTAWNGVASWWNSTPLWAKIGMALLVVAIVALIVFVGPEALIGAIVTFFTDTVGGFVAGTLGPLLTETVLPFLTSPGFVTWVLRPGLSGLLNGAFTFGWDYFFGGQSLQASFQDAALSAVTAVVAYGVGAAILKPAIKSSKVALNLEHGLANRFGENWLAKRFGVSALRGVGASKVYTAIGGRLASAGVSVVALALQVFNDTYLGLPIPRANPASTVSQIITNMVLLPHAGSMSTQAGKVALDVAKATGMDFLTAHGIEAGSQLVNPPPVSAPGLMHTPTSTYVAPHGAPGDLPPQPAPTPPPTF